MAMRTENLAKLMRRKRDLLAQMLKVGLRQQELIEQEGITDLLKLLSAKQQLIDAVIQTEQALNEFRNEDPEQREWSSAEARTACAKDAEDCRRLYEQIVHLETEQEEKLSNRRDNIATQLRSIQSTQSVHKSYQPHHRPAPESKPPIPMTGNHQPPASPGSLDLTAGN